MKERSGIIVWLHSTKNIKALRRFGSIYYYSRRLKYVSMYCDLDERDDIVKRLEKLRFVKRVELSFLHEIKREYEGKKEKGHKSSSFSHEDPLTLLPS